MAYDDGSQDALLLLDTCGERASVAVMRADGTLLAQRRLGEREASTGLLGALHEVLLETGLALREIACVGVVNGPGSFTGVRVGLAVAKGLCEAVQLPMAAVSRLEVLAEAGRLDGLCLISAGREQVYARVGHGNHVSERLLHDDDLSELRVGRSVLVDSPGLLARLATGGPVQQIELTASNALNPVLHRWYDGGSDAASVDANYVRDEGAIYRRSSPTAMAGKSW